MTGEVRDRVAYKILTDAQMAELLDKGRFAGAPVDLADGYIHMSTAGQVGETLDKHFAGQAGLHIAAVDLMLFGDTVQWEVSRGGALFPHLYADLPLDAVIAHGPAARDSDGVLILPGNS
jgi:uncharacterized protein (DUF952 family)